MELPITPYGLLTDEQKQYIWDNWDCAEFYNGAGGWVKAKKHYRPSPRMTETYRINRSIAKPRVNSAVLHPKYKWLALDSFGNIIAYDRKPEIGRIRWDVPSGTHSAVNITHSAINPKLYDAGTCDWKDSLVYIGEEE